MELNNRLKITSEAFDDGMNIPSKYTCEGENINPPLRVENMPPATQTLAIIVDDPDAPGATYDHWLVWNIPPDINIEENRVPGSSGKNSSGKTGYYGPCPPTGSHRYYFHVFALDIAISLGNGADRKTLENEMKDHILATGVLMGRYQKKGKR